MKSYKEDKLLLLKVFTIPYPKQVSLHKLRTLLQL